MEDNDGRAAPRLSSVELFIIGAAAGAGAKTATAPLDRIRLIYQVYPSNAFSLGHAARMAADIAKRAGAEGLWKGHTATLWRVMPFAGVQFSVYDAVGAGVLVREASCNQSLVARSAVAGAIAASSATLATYPLDVLRTRMVMHLGSAPPYNNYLSAVENIFRHEGFPAFYRGLAPTLLGVFPFGAISFSMFEVLKRQLRLYHQVEMDAGVPFWEKLVVGGLSGAFSQVLVYPLHVVRRRMQASGLATESAQVPISNMFKVLDKNNNGYLSRSDMEAFAKRLGVPVDELWKHFDARRTGQVSFEAFKRYSNAYDFFRQIRDMEGVRGGLFKGASLAWIKGPITVGFAFVMNDSLKYFISHRHMHDEGDQYAPLPGQQHSVASSSGAVAQLHAIERLVCGGTAGAIAKTVIAPGDRIKIIYQVDATQKFAWRHAWKTICAIVEREGGRGLWRGHGATLLRVVPYSATSFATFEPYKRRLREAMPESSDTTIRFLAGAAAGATATSLTYPFDVFRARMAAHQGAEAPYHGYFRALQHIVRTEGKIALWKGLRPTLLGIVPYSGISFCLFETLKAKIVEARGRAGDADLRIYERLASGGLAGLVAQSITYPTDLVRRRMQVKPLEYRNELQTIQCIFRNEGIRGFFKGLSLNWIKGPLAISVSFLVNDMLHVKVAQWQK